MTTILMILGAIIAAFMVLMLGWYVHCGLDRFCTILARRFCVKRGLAIHRSRTAIATGASAVKTEFTIVELDCIDSSQQRRLIRLLVWVFGVRELLSDENYPASHDESWPQSAPLSPQK